MTDTKRCTVCGCTFARSRNRTRAEFALQETCGSDACKGAIRRQRAWADVVLIRVCESCGQEYGPPPPKYSIFKWKHRTACGVACASVIAQRTLAAKRHMAKCPICDTMHTVAGATCGSSACKLELRRRRDRERQRKRAEIAEAQRISRRDGAPTWTIDMPRADAIRSMVQECSTEYRAAWLEGMPPKVRERVGRIMAGMR